ncbi:MAG: phosphoenolpyruvate synthase [Firmicutes bacterium]|nr:phosphoenolpyruvate synthase [Bacillota bacterium]
MSEMIYSFKKLPKNKLKLAGGKGGTLSKLLQAGYPVPDGFVILSNAFDDNNLKSKAVDIIKKEIKKLRTDDKVKFAVRSSALSEDSKEASFAGEFETILNVKSEKEIFNAISEVIKSTETDRVKAYSKVKGMTTKHQISIVIQRMVPSEISGVLFTTDPVTGAKTKILGNYVYGLGEKLVSGETNAETFTITRPTRIYEGPKKLKEISNKIYDLAVSLEEYLEGPQDIEWTVVNNKLYLLQSRPITTIEETKDPIMGKWNYSSNGDFLWTNQMTAEVYPEVITPSTWSVWNIYYKDQNIEGYPGIGIIGGRVYINYSLTYSIMIKIFRKHDKVMEWLEGILGEIPENIKVPIMPISLSKLLFQILPREIKGQIKKSKLKKKQKKYINNIPSLCEEISQEIDNIKEKRSLINLWEGKLKPVFLDVFTLQDTMNEDFFRPYISLKKKLTNLIGKDDAEKLLATLSGGSEELESIGPLLGLSKLVEGKITRKEYESLYGHRHPNENELSEPRPIENPKYINKQIENFKESPVDVNELVKNRSLEFMDTWNNFKKKYPSKEKGLKKKINEIENTMYKREKVRSELTRIIGIIRKFYLMAGKLTKLNKDIFFLTVDEVINLLRGDNKSISYINLRKEYFRKYKSLPSYPQFIRGYFDPIKWSEEFYDSDSLKSSNTIKGYAASEGKVKGIVRRIDSPEEGELLKPGEILVTATTNIGWTPLFPKAKAIITDIGAQLSHAAIVAREIGIPAVVGCRDATKRINTGDKVIVDGGRGIVKIIESKEK